ncbi:MAG TPA: hypothetical protein DCE42_24710 [Myxococcales bacterium]|nr:hypothetical protein [Deltaproteobacteria bacterium]HAA57990.1 hypothetical protein [Myxococcales bacterium]
MKNNEIIQKLTRLYYMELYDGYTVKHLLLALVALFVLIWLFRFVWTFLKSKEVDYRHHVQCKNCGWSGTVEFEMKRCPRCGHQSFQKGK